MKIDSAFMFRLVCGFLLIMQTTARLWMAQQKPPSLNSRFEEKTREQLFIRLAGVAVSLCYLYVFLPDTTYFDFHIPIVLRWIGAGLMLAGNILFLSARSALGTFWSAELEIQPGHQLIQTGIYRWIRHPMYTGFLLFGEGIILLSANFFCCIYLPITTAMIFTRLPTEEAMLAREFGKEFEKYRSQTCALIPWIY
ncbi:methyltransferase family protein [Leptolinea tardivitalis]|uniref:methyltransferase family protein n=1 Tax=Leptolinea tardivitalis TaxID=229920 RepID=UPI000785C00C|nr:isoprenylcysteine carboxylmethyltransferase family protein [Leptolinea tardivitalis]GAP21691.1 putative protein-S-isoprenylcysteine methyltransferase [Leptolinea tardivitalis]